MAITAQQVAAHAEDLRLTSLYSDLGDWIEQAADQMRERTPEGDIADAIHTALFELKQRLEPTIERLARREAEAEARRQEEEAEDDARWAEMEGAA